MLNPTGNEANQKRNLNQKVKIDGWRWVAASVERRQHDFFFSYSQMAEYILRSQTQTQDTGICIKYKWQQFRRRVRMLVKRAERCWRDGNRRQRAIVTWKVYTEDENVRVWRGDVCSVSFNQSRCKTAKWTQFLDYLHWKCATLSSFRCYAKQATHTHTACVLLIGSPHRAKPPHFSRINASTMLEMFFGAHLTNAVRFWSPNKVRALS